MEDAGPPQQHQPLMTKLPGLTPSHHGTTTLIQRARPCYQLHRPHLALPAQPAPGLEPPFKLLKAEPDSPAELAALAQAALAPSPAQQPLHARQQARQLQQHPHLQQQQLQQHQQQQQQQPLAAGRQAHPHQAHQPPQAQSRPRPARHQAATTTHVSCLYPEILALIFSKLDVRDRGRAAQVCVKWREAAYDKTAWRGVEAKLHLKKHSSQVLFSCLKERGINRVQVLSLNTRRGLGDVFNSLPKLQSLNLSGCYNMSDAGLNNALSHAYPCLTELNLSLCKNITDAGLIKIAEVLKNLESLELGGCGNISNMGLQMIALGLKKLKRLDLRSCWHISDHGIAYVAGVSCENAGNLALEYLGLQDCQRLTDESLRHISQGLAGSLKSINLSFCVLITDLAMKHVAKITSLRELDLRSCDTISEAGMAYLVEGGSRISSLDVSFCDKIGDLALQHISQGLFNLKSLSLSACPISDEGICKIAKTQHELETLHIGQCSRLTDKSVFTIIESMPHLRCIDLYGCTRISKFGLEKIHKLRISLNLGLWQERR